jgi:cysteine desulfurase
MRMREPVYLDWNATAPARPGVAAAMADALAVGANASSVHGRGRAARGLVDAARERLAAALGVRPQDVAFTSGGTEANRLALAGTGRPRLLASAVEHASVAAFCPAEGVLPVDSDGRLSLEALAAALRQRGRETLVSVMLANNETGVEQPVAEAAALAHAAGALLHCDAVQGLGKRPFDLAALGADLMTVSAHKIGGPAGVGALILRPGLAFATDRAAGGQERGYRPGTENLAGIAGFAAALAHLDASLADQPRQAALRDRLEASLTAAGAIVFGSGAARLANTACLAMPGVPAETQVMAFDLAGFCVSAGAACSSGKVQASAVLTAMGLPAELSTAAIRVSIGHDTTEVEIDAFAAAWKHLFARRRAA